MRVVVCESNERNQNLSVGDVIRVVVFVRVMKESKP